MPVPSLLIRLLIHELHAYVPGEQPKIKGLIKLNTNENPYPPSPRVLRTVRRAVDGRLRLYPNPTAERLRGKLAKLHRCRPENIILGNGSDELLALAVRCFVEPEGRVTRVPNQMKRRASSAGGERRSPTRHSLSRLQVFPFSILAPRSLCLRKYLPCVLNLECWPH